MKTTIPTCSIIATVCLSSSSNAFRNGRIPPPRHNGRPSPTSREYKSSNSLEGDESRRIDRQIQQMSSSPSPMPSHNYSASSRSQSRTSLSVATLEGSSESGRSFPDGRGAAEEVVDSLISNMNLPVVVVVARGGNLLMDDVIPVLSASLLVTGNTVGSSMFVLPEAVRGVGLAWGSVIFLGERARFPRSAPRSPSSSSSSSSSSWHRRGFLRRVGETVADDDDVNIAHSFLPINFRL